MKNGVSFSLVGNLRPHDSPLRVSGPSARLEGQGHGPLSRSRFRGRWGDRGFTETVGAMGPSSGEPSWGSGLGRCSSSNLGRVIGGPRGPGDMACLGPACRGHAEKGLVWWPGGMVSGPSQLSPHSRPREVECLGLRGLAGDPCPPSSPAHPQRAAQRVSRGPGPGKGSSSPNTTPQTGEMGLETPDLCSPTGWGQKPEVEATQDHTPSTGSRGRPFLPHLAMGSGPSGASGPITLTSAPASQGLLFRVCVLLLLLMRTMAA